MFHGLSFWFLLFDKVSFCLAFLIVTRILDKHFGVENSNSKS